MKISSRMKEAFIWFLMPFNSLCLRIYKASGRADERRKQNLSLDKRPVSSSVYGTFPWLFTESSEATRWGIGVCFHFVVLCNFDVLFCQLITGIYYILLHTYVTWFALLVFILVWFFSYQKKRKKNCRLGVAYIYTRVYVSYFYLYPLYIALLAFA